MTRGEEISRSAMRVPISTSGMRVLIGTSIMGVPVTVVSARQKSTKTEGAR